MERFSELGAPAQAELMREGEYWTAFFEGRETRVRDSKGVRYLAELLRHPGREVSALALAAHANHPGERGASTAARNAELNEAGEGDLGPILDGRGKAALKERLQELGEELERARVFNDDERAALARLEYEAIGDQLAAATGRGGRDRRTGSPSERARLNVTRAIRTTIVRFNDHDPALGEHLSASVTTGRLCAYKPQPGNEVSWYVRERPARTTLSARFHPPETLYAESDGLSIAYQVLGEGPADLVLVTGWISHLDFFWTDPLFTRFLRRLAGFSRLIIFDKRGVGLSDPVAAVPTLEQRIDDLRAVMDAAKSDSAAIFGISEGGPMAALFAATFPERTQKLLFYGAYAAGPGVHDHPGREGLAETHRRLQAAVETAWGQGDSLWVMGPNLAHNRLMRRGWGVLERAALSPGLARSLLCYIHDVDVRAALPAIQAPTLVLHRTGDCVPIAMGRYIAEQIPDARFVELEGDTHLPITGDVDAIVDEIEDFVVNAPSQVRPTEGLATLLALHLEATSSPSEATLQAITAAGGSVNSAGDGALSARFDGPLRAIRCWQGLIADSEGSHGDVRAGLHTGPCFFEGSTARGIGFDIAAAAALQAAEGEILVTGTVRDLIVGTELGLERRGMCRLPHVPGTWPLFAVTNGAEQQSIEEAGTVRTVSLADRAARTVARHAPGAARSALRLMRNQDRR